MPFVEYASGKNFHSEDVSGKQRITAAWCARYPTGILVLLYEKQPGTLNTILHIVFSSGISSEVNHGERYIHVTRSVVSIGNSSYIPELDDEGEFKRRLPTQDTSVLRGFWPSVRRSPVLPPLAKEFYKKAVYGEIPVLNP
ncbi:hypothetical protein HY388_00565 [Candidatus Daviesbacteria bacterium]|nr:hypothetical protein [Candidatus Daviesbacteria bacterium]